jgi:hypothetical protein
MDINNLLGNLSDAAYDKLKEISFPENDSDCIYLLIDESLGDCFSFCLKKDNAQYEWIRKQWRKQHDIAKVTSPVDQVKFIAQKLLPHISTQSGATQLNEANEIFIYAQQNMDLDKDAVSDFIQLDGTEYTMQIFTGERKAVYRWDQLPSQWASLDKLLNMMLDLNNKLA